jgi:hypothetical protein
MLYQRSRARQENPAMKTSYPFFTLTARMITSENATTSAFEVVTDTPTAFWASRDAKEGSDAIVFDAVATFLSKNPLIIAVAMTPAPMNPNLNSPNLNDPVCSLASLAFPDFFEADSDVFGAFDDESIAESSPDRFLDCEIPLRGFDIVKCFKADLTSCDQFKLASPLACPKVRFCPELSALSCYPLEGLLQ